MSQLFENIRSGNFPEVIKALNAGETFDDSMQSQQWSEVYDRLIAGRQYAILQKMIEGGMLPSLDLYEYQNYMGTLVHAAGRGIKEESAEALEFLQCLATRTENMDEEIRGETLIGHLMNAQAEPFVIRAFLDNGFPVNAKNHSEANLIFQAAQINMLPEQQAAAYVTLLAELGCEVDAPNVVRETALMQAVSHRKRLLAETLLNLGANPNEADSEGKTAYYRAVAEQQDFDMYQVLRQRQPPDLSLLTRDKTSILFQYLCGHIYPGPKTIGLLKALLEDGADLYQTCEHYGAETTPADFLAQAPFEIFAAALESGKVDIARRDSKGDTLLHQVCGYDANYDERAAKELYRKAKLLVDNGAEIEAANDAEQTPMMLAATDNLKSKIVELLISRK